MNLAFLTFIFPEFSNFLGGFVQPVMVSRELDHFDGGKPNSPPPWRKADRKAGERVTRP